jgi:hypothetical protein
VICSTKIVVQGQEMPEYCFIQGCPNHYRGKKTLGAATNVTHPKKLRLFYVLYFINIISFLRYNVVIKVVNMRYVKQSK